MNGVTIVETISSEVPQTNGSIIVIIALIAISLAAIYESMTNFASKRKIEGFSMLLVVVVSLVIGLFSIGAFTKPQEDTLYVVMIDESVKAKEFHENYEIISVENDRYTVRLINKEH